MPTLLHIILRARDLLTQKCAQKVLVSDFQTVIFSSWNVAKIGKNWVFRFFWKSIRSNVFHVLKNVKIAEKVRKSVNCWQFYEFKSHLKKVGRASSIREPIFNLMFSKSMPWPGLWSCASIFRYMPKKIICKKIYVKKIYVKKSRAQFLHFVCFSHVTSILGFTKLLK
jgi:hypothetical protein